MGSKRVMLGNGLGEVLAREAAGASRVVDLFCGSGAVSWFAATELGKPVLALDLQRFATTLAGAVVERTEPLDFDDLEERWLRPALAAREATSAWAEALALDDSRLPTEVRQERAKRMCAGGAPGDSGLVWANYGGHYFSPAQALTLDALLDALPEGDRRMTCLAATIVAASQCAASPGHTAQPFKATGGAGEYLERAWNRDPVGHARKAAREIGSRFARARGAATAADANEVAGTLDENDLVFVDPPYSSVQYSRFYHVLETIARGECGPVAGVGRYPPFEERPQSRYSRKSDSRAAIRELLGRLAERGCRVVLTFPRGEASTGLSGLGIAGMARRLFRVTRRSVATRFSTLGGNGTNREARKDTKELILVLTPE